MLFVFGPNSTFFQFYVFLVENELKIDINRAYHLTFRAPPINTSTVFWNFKIFVWPNTFLSILLLIKLKVYGFVIRPKVYKRNFKDVENFSF